MLQIYRSNHAIKGMVFCGTESITIFFGGSTEEQHFRYSGISAPNAAYTVPSAQRVKGKTRKTTFYPGNRRIALTKEGMSLRKRAEEITELVQKASDEIIAYDAMLAGDILIGAGKQTETVS